MNNLSIPFNPFMHVCPQIIDPRRTMPACLALSAENYLHRLTLSHIS